MEYRFTLFADYFQFYLQDDNSEVGDLSGSWSKEAVENLLAVAPYVVGVRTVRNMTVPITIDVREDAPDSDFSGWDHVTETSLDVPSGRIVVAGCTDYWPEAARIPVTPGTYATRVYYGALDTRSPDGLNGEDHYRVVLWPDGHREPTVLKRRVR